MMTCLAGSVILMTLETTGIRGFKLAHYALCIYPILGAALAWSIWPKKPKGIEPFSSGRPMSKADADTLNEIYKSSDISMR
jgi:hypothetical protein